MDLFWTNMDYLGSDSSGLESVWIYSGPIRIPNQNFWPPLVMSPDQIILSWDQHGFFLGQYHTDGFILGRYNHEPNKCGLEACSRHTPRGSASEGTDTGVETDTESRSLLKLTHPCSLAHNRLDLRRDMRAAMATQFGDAPSAVSTSQMVSRERFGRVIIRDAYRIRF